jgi:hypothetical protein
VVGKDVVDGRGRNEGALAAKISKSEGKEKEIVALSIESLDEAVLLFFLKYQLGKVDSRFGVDKFLRLMRVLFVLLFRYRSCHQLSDGPQSHFGEWKGEWSGEWFWQ